MQIMDLLDDYAAGLIKEFKKKDCICFITPCLTIPQVLLIILNNFDVSSKLKFFFRKFLFDLLFH